MFSFQSLHPGHFVIADNPLALLSQLGGLLIDGIDIFVLALKLVIVLAGEPVTDLMRFEIGLFLKDVRRDGPRFVRQYPV